jgi:uncharacterized protein YndB with AHSA1/START domain
VAEPFVTEIEIDAPAEEVFRHLTEPRAMLAWMGQHAVLEPLPGGRFELDVNGVPIRGQYVTVEALRRVVVSWGVAGSDELPAGATEVEFTLTATARGTHLRLEHRNLPEAEVPKHAEGWAHFLERLAIAATGADAGRDTWASQ